jgi:Ca-activated chloride channel family protein
MSIDKSSLPPSNLVFLIDVSGSMSDRNKLPLLKSAFGLLVNELRALDRVAIVVYAGAAGLVREFGGTLFTIAKDVKFQIEFNPVKVESYRLIGYENRLLNDEDFNDDTKDAGEMGAGHNVTALYELVPSGSGERIPSVDPLKYQLSTTIDYQKNDSSDEFLTIKLRYKKPDGNTSMLLEIPVKGYINDLEDASDNLRFAAAVSEFGMILRDSEFKGNATLEGAARLARSARGEDEDGYRSELIRLINTVKDMRVLADKE